MSGHDDNSHARRSFSNIDDGLNLLLAELKSEDGAPAYREGPITLHGFTPFLKSESLGPEPVAVRMAATPGATSAGLAGLLLATASSYTVLKVGGSAATPLVLPNAFIPVPAALGPDRALAGKLRPGAAAPLLQLQRSRSTGQGAFTIPAYDRPFTQLDMISTDDLEDSATLGAGLSYRFSPAANTGLADFGDIVDGSRLGELPTDEDLSLLLFESTAAMPAAPAAFVTNGSCGGSGSASANGTAMLMQTLPSATLLQQCSGQSSTIVGAEPLLMPAALPPPAATGQRAAAAPVLRIRTGAGATSNRGGPDSGSPKRRADRLDFDPSPRAVKRHSGSTGSAWSEGTEENGGDSGGSGDLEITSPQLAWFTTGPQHQWGNTASVPPSRFSIEHSRRSSAVVDPDPSYTPTRQRSRAAARQQPHQAAWGEEVEEEEAEEEEEMEVEAAVAPQEPQPPPPLQQYRGVSRHRLTQRWEASLWLNGRQLYLGGFNSQEDAAHAYDLAALACKGLDAQINFAADKYASQLKEVAGYSRDEVVAYVRRRSSAFSRGKSRYRGVSGHNGRWEARIGSFTGRKNVSFGVFDSEEGAARQYDRALILEKGRIAKTNFPIRDYDSEVAEYEAFLMLKYGTTRGPAVAADAARTTMPRNREATADEKKRSAVIYADVFMKALRQAPAASGRGRG